MKLFLLFAFALCANAAPVGFSWSPNKEWDLAGYRLYRGPSSGVYTNWDFEPKTATNCTLEVVGTEYFVLTAVNLSGQESLPTYELVWTPYVSLRLISERSIDLFNWEPVATNTVLAAHPMEFWRVRLVP